MPLQATSGAASYDAFGGGVAAVPNYIEDVFSTWLYTGNGSTQTITNGIDLAGKGGLVWVKSRSNAFGHVLVDTVRGAGNFLSSNTTNQQFTNNDTISAFTASSFSVGNRNDTNSSGLTYASWTFREQPKFFDVQTISHTNGTATNISLTDLGTVGTVIAKITTTTGDWITWHRSLTAGNNLRLNTTAAQTTTNAWLSVSGTTATLASAAPTGTYVIYSYAHNAGGFGLTGTDNVISCGSFTTDGSEKATVSLGYEPQWVMIKAANAASDWFVMDSMRGMPVSGNGAALSPNSSSAETAADYIRPNATGFSANNLGSSLTWVYIAIRRGPMRVPTTGASVFYPGVGNTNPSTYATGFPIDLAINSDRSGGGGFTNLVFDRLRGSQTTSGNYLQTSSPNAEVNVGAGGIQTDSNTQTKSTGLFGTASQVIWTFRRAPGFMDVCCYTGTGSARTVAHNLAAVPELMIVKRRDSTGEWKVYTTATGSGNELVLNSQGSVSATDAWNNTTPTASVFSIGSPIEISGATYVAYLFASAPGVSKVGSFTGTGATQVINCGFTGGSRFVLIKATNSANPAPWYVWDSARGIVAGNDPYLALNSTAAEVTNTDWVDTAASGFELSNAGGNLANSNGVSYIFLAVA